MTAMVDDNNHDETDSLYVVGPDKDGGDGSWCGV